jgi:hypothetical protein
MEYPRPAHVAVWRDAARRLLAQSRYAALLVSLHGTSLYDRWVDTDAHPPAVAAEIRDYLDGQRALQAELAQGIDPAELDRNRRLLLALDGLSLALCHERGTTLDGVPGATGPASISVAPDAATGRFLVDPWPFAADRVAVACEATPVDGSLAAGPWVPVRWELSPR